MITDNLHTEMRFRHIMDIATLDNERNNGVNSMHNMPTNNDFLVEIDPDHNNQNSSVKNCRNYDTSVDFNKSLC